MAKPRRSKKQLNTTAVARATVLPTHVPKRWVKFIVGVFLLPLAWILSQTFFSVFMRATLRDHFWLTEECWFFALGCILWIGAFIGLPRPMWIYVFGHELTHAMVVWVMGGKVSKFKVTSEGGHIETNRVNTWIALSPYFIPIYSILAVVLWGWASVIYDLSDYRQALYALIGAGWAFHLTFTMIMIPKGQTDLAYGGTFFSMVLIYIMNIIVLTMLFMLASPTVKWSDFGSEFLQNTMDFCSLVFSLLRRIPLHLPA
ncbi:MAG: hypothetical protein ABIP97_02775 [Chthoniobacterales bacterium]